VCKNFVKTFSSVERILQKTPGLTFLTHAVHELPFSFCWFAVPKCFPRFRTCSRL